MRSLEFLLNTSEYIYFTDVYAAREVSAPHKLKELSSQPNQKHELLNHKGALQEHCVKNGVNTPTYGVLSRDGLDHKPSFTCYVRVGNKQVEGTAMSKKDAEQEAAKKMLQQLELAHGPEKSLFSSALPDLAIGMYGKVEKIQPIR